MPLACWGYSIEEQRPQTLLQNHGHDGSPSLLPRHVGWIDIVDVRAQSPLAVSGALRGLGGKKAEVRSTLCTISSVGSEWLLWFSSMV
jgi:hypothetical protein